MSIDELRVLFVTDIYSDEVTAIFPDLPATNDPNTMVCYAHIGQHSTCTVEWYKDDCSIATQEQYHPLHIELSQVYDDYKLIIIDTVDLTSYYNRLTEINKHK